MTTNPDIIIATPGRFLHLKVEMGLDLSSVKYICFDEADRLFEMGFASQLAEILHALPTSRQTLLFSATLPKSLVEFARAGLQDPKLIRLDAESKISPDLKSAYFTVKSGDRDGALLYLLQQVIKVPTGETDAAKARKEEGTLSVGAKRKRKQFTAKDAAVAESTIIFAATKHRVEYLSELLKSLGYPVSYCKSYLITCRWSYQANRPTQYMVIWTRQHVRLTWKNSVLASLVSWSLLMLLPAVLTCLISTTSSITISHRSQRSACIEWDEQLALDGRAGHTVFVDTLISRMYWIYSCSLANGCLSVEPPKKRTSPKTL